MSTISKNEFRKVFAKRHGSILQKKLDNTTVAICGLGGLGSNVAILLSRSGVGKLILIDYDKVDISNIHRQQYKVSQIGEYKTSALLENLKEISPYTNYESKNERITEDNIKRLLSTADIICEAFDDASNKAMLVNYVLENMPEKFLVAASGMAGISDGNLIKTKKISEKFYLCGDSENGVSDITPLFATRVSICAAHQAHAIIRIIEEKN